MAAEVADVTVKHDQPIASAEPAGVGEHWFVAWFLAISLVQIICLCLVVHVTTQPLKFGVLINPFEMSCAFDDATAKKPTADRQALCAAAYEQNTSDARLPACRDARNAPNRASVVRCEKPNELFYMISVLLLVLLVAWTCFCMVAVLSRKYGPDLSGKPWLTLAVAAVWLGGATALVAATLDEFFDARGIVAALANTARGRFATDSGSDPLPTLLLLMLALSISSCLAISNVVFCLRFFAPRDPAPHAGGEQPEAIMVQPRDGPAIKVAVGQVSITTPGGFVVSTQAPKPPVDGNIDFLVNSHLALAGLAFVYGFALIGTNAKFYAGDGQQPAYIFSYLAIWATYSVMVLVLPAIFVGFYKVFMERLSKLRPILLGQAVLALHALLMQNQEYKKFAETFAVVVKPLGL